MPTGVDCTISAYENRSKPGFSTGDLGLYAINLPYYEDIEESGGVATYEDQIVRGRSEEHIFYSNTSADLYNFTAKLVASVDQGDGRNAKTIWKEYLFLKSFQYPDYNYGKGPVGSPRRALITIGKWFNYMGVIKDPGATFSRICDEDGYPLVIDIRFMFRVINTTPRDYRDILSGRYGS
jgi:hypothetical protein